MFPYKVSDSIIPSVVQNVKSRSGVFDGSYQILTVEIVAELGAPGLWLNIQVYIMYILFYP